MAVVIVGAVPVGVLILILKAMVSLPVLFVALTVNANVPAVVGVPEMVLPDKLRPSGRSPLSMLHVIGESPVASSVWL